jgi:uncharacterized protein
VNRLLENLLELQNVDLRLNELRARLATFPKRIAEIDARVASAKSELDSSKATQLATVKDRKKHELDVEQWKERVRKYKDQSSQVKTNEAYKALQHEVELAEAEIAKAEDRLLEQMVAGEEYDRRVKSSEKSLKEVETAAAAQRAKLEVEKTAIEKEIADLQAERSRVLSVIPEDLAEHYDRIARKHKGVALAEVREEKCSACGMRVRPQVFQEMRRPNSEELFHCETCTRILYYIEPAASVAAANSAGADSANSNSASNEA